MGELEAATKAALEAAQHLTKQDAGATEALLTVARKVDQDEERWALALQWAEAMKVKPPARDNVSLPTYLKFCESLGLTPAGRTKLGETKSEAPGGKLALLRGEAQAKRKTG